MTRLLTLAAGALIAIGPALALAADVDVLLETETTVIGQPIIYPKEGKPKITSAIVTLQPGEETGTHQHPILLFGYVLEGELTIVYDHDGGKEVHLKAGDTVVEAHDVWHNGHNSGDGPLRILVVYMGDTAQPNTVVKPDP